MSEPHEDRTLCITLEATAKHAFPKLRWVIGWVPNRDALFIQCVREETMLTTIINWRRDMSVYCLVTIERMNGAMELIYEG